METVSMLTLTARQEGSWDFRWQGEKSHGNFQIRGGEKALRLFWEVADKLGKEGRELWLSVTLPLSLFPDLCEIVDGRPKAA